MQRSLRKFLINFRYAFRINKPVLLMRLAKAYVRILFLRQRPLRYMDLAVGFDCNLKCEHCFAAALRDDKRKRITPSEYREVVRQAMELGAVNFSFQGGEPLLYPELIKFIENSFPSRNLISVTTNATLLDERKLHELKKAGVDILTISLDSAEAVQHDRFRGVDGSFDRTLGGIKMALKNGFRVTLGAVVSHQNIRRPDFLGLIKLAHELNVVIFLALAAPLGRYASRDNIMLTEEDRQYLDGLLKQYPLLRTDFDANFLYCGCGAVKEILYVNPYGDVMACPFLHFSLGNILQKPLKVIRDEALKYDFFNRYNSTCLAAQDKAFMEKALRYSFYNPDCSPVTIKQIFVNDAGAV